MSARLQGNSSDAGLVPVYSQADQSRRIVESTKFAMRTAFERDRARTLHSSGLRRLEGKTQALGPANDDFVRTRLTHSLEVAQVGRGLGKEPDANLDVVDAACLSHDPGHPPFGYNGERVLDDLAADCGGSEGDAQTLRLVSCLEPKVIGEDGESAGLNLTCATFDAICKYPWIRGEGPNPDKSSRKYSVYEDDHEVFEWVREGAPFGRRCLEAQIMDLSDDIAYNVHDVEDAVATGKCDVHSLRGDEVLERVIASTLDWYSPGVARADLESAIERLVHLGEWTGSFDGSYADLARLKDLTSELIGRFCFAVVSVTRMEFGPGPLGRYRADLVVPPSTRAEIQVLKGLTVHFVVSPHETESVYYQQRTLLADLVDALVEARPNALESVFAAWWRQSSSEEGCVRAVIDQAASLTDSPASKRHACLCGMLSSQLRRASTQFTGTERARMCCRVRYARR